MTTSRQAVKTSVFLCTLGALLTAALPSQEPRPLCDAQRGEECIPDTWSIVFPEVSPRTDASSTNSILRRPLSFGDTFETRAIIEAESPLIQGFQFSVRHDPEVLTLLSASNEGTFFDSDVPGAIVAPPYFSITHLAYAEPTDEGPVEGYVSSVALSFVADVSLPAGRHVACVAHYEVERSARTQIRFAHGELGPTRVDPVGFFVTVNGRGTVPSTVIDATVDPSSREFRRADVNSDASVNLTDVVLLVRILLGIQPPFFDCEKVMDSNDDGAVNLTDGIAVLNWLFRSAPRLPGPFLECGEDPSVDDLSCTLPAGCE